MRRHHPRLVHRAGYDVSALRARTRLAIVRAREDDDGVSWMHWSDPAGMRREMLEYYPGVAIHGRGYINVAGCSHGTGDPYFIRARDEDDPAVIQVAHDVSDDPELILRDGVFVVTRRLSELFTNAFVGDTREREA